MKKMSNLIDRQAAIDAVEHITSSMSVCVNTDECHGMKRMQRQAVIELANLPSTQPEPQWISTAKRLPEIKQRVLITYNTEDGLKTDVTWYDTYGFMLSENVTAWMPMVEPYRAERKTDEKKNI